MSNLPLLSNPCPEAKPPEGWPFWPYSLVSLMELLEFYAPKFWKASCDLGQLWPIIKNFQRIGAPAPSENDWETTTKLVFFVRNECIRLGFPEIEAHTNRIIIMMKKNPPNAEAIGSMLGELYSRMYDALNSKRFAFISKAHYYEQNQFQGNVILRFKDHIYEMEESGKCFALCRYTACVFHLMRVTEAVLHALGVFVEPNKYDPNATPAESWQKILGILRDHLQTPNNRPHLKNHYQFLSNAQAQMFAVNKAWRDKTMHLEKKYTEEEAHEIFNATKGLMRYLAENLPA